MESSHLWPLVSFFTFLFLSALFSAAETAFRSVNTPRLQQLFDDGNHRLKLGLQLMASPEKLRGVLVIGDNLFNIAAVFIAAFYYISNFTNLHIALFFVALIIIILTIGEIIPKSIGSLYPEAMICHLSPLISFFTILLYPLISIMLWVRDLVLLVFGGNPEKSKPFITEEELMSYVNASHEDGVLEVEEKKMIYNVVEFGDIEVSQIMTPRIDMTAAPIESTYDDLYALFKQEQVTRIPIYEENIDHVIGILNIKKWMFFEGDPLTFKITDHMRKPFFTYESKKTSELLNEMRLKKHQMTIVVDEYGGTAGLVTLEDLIEEIVGEIDDEFDDDAEDIELIGDLSYRIDGTTHLSDVNERLGTELESEDFDSLGGFIMGILGRLPEAGEVVAYENLEFTVLNIERNRIGQIDVQIIDAPEMFESENSLSENFSD